MAFYFFRPGNPGEHFLIIKNTHEMLFLASQSAIDIKKYVKQLILMSDEKKNEKSDNIFYDKSCFFCVHLCVCVCVCV